MRTHTKIGWQILAGSNDEVLKLAAEIALSHHERFDGTGYPSGLVGEDIPLAGRIVAVADVFEALTSRRPYRAPLTVEVARAYVEEGRGTQFDPLVADAFLRSEAIRRMPFTPDGSTVA